VDVAIDGVNPDTAVELNIGLRTSDHPLRFGTRSAGRRVVEPVEYADAPRVAVLKEDFVEPHIDANRGINWILVEDAANRGAGHFGCIAGILAGGQHRRFLKRGKKIAVLLVGNMIRNAAR